MKLWFLRASDWLGAPRRLIGLLALMMMIILGGSVMPSLTASSNSFITAVLKNSLHIPIYLVLTLMLFLFYRRSHFFSHNKRRALALAAATSFVIGVCIEIIQTFVPYRTADLFDIALNLWGILIFIVSVHYYWHRKNIIRRLSFRPMPYEYQFMARDKEMMMLRERLLQIIGSNPAFIIFVTSTFPQEGKTTLARGLLCALSQFKPIYLLELGSGQVFDAAGTGTGQIADETEFNQWVAQARENQALLIIDGEAVSAEAHRFPAAIVAGVADYILWVLAEGRVTVPQFTQAMNLLALPEQKMQGLVFNSIF
jgi:VanZ family protein